MLNMHENTSRRHRVNSNSKVQQGRALRAQPEEALSDSPEDSFVSWEDPPLSWEDPPLSWEDLLLSWEPVDSVAYAARSAKEKEMSFSSLSTWIV